MVISNKSHHELEVIGSKPCILYSLPKVHKPNFLLRPIVYALGTHAYKLAKCLFPLPRPFSTNSYTINDTFGFVKEVTEQTINTNYAVIASFNLKSLFKNIPLD